MEKYRILFVCMGNICRSPAAEGVFRKLLAGSKLEERVEVESAGTIQLHEGEPADARMQEAAGERGYALTSRARAFSHRDFQDFDLILTMDNQNYREVTRQKPEETHRAEVKRFCDFCREHTEKEVPDPYYGGGDGFQRVLDLLEDGCRSLLRQVCEKVS